MKALSRDGVRRLAKLNERPVATIYLPTEIAGPQTRKSPIRFKNLLTEAKKRLDETPGGRRLRQRLEADCDPKISDDDFWQHQSHGLAVFCDEHACELHPLDIAPPEIVVIGRRFYIKPLLPLIGRNEPYLLLALSGNRCELFRGDLDRVEPVQVEGLPHSLEHALRFDEPEKSLQYHTGAPGSRAAFHGQGSSGDARNDRFRRYFQAVAGALQPLLEQEKLPLLLATVDDHVPVYARVSSYSGLITDEWISGSPDDLSADELARRARTIFVDRAERAQQEAVEHLRSLAGANGAAADLKEISAAVVQGRVQAAFVASDQSRSGSIDPVSGELHLDGEGEGDADADASRDVLNDLAAETLLHGGDAHAVPAQALPARSAAAAIFRF